MRILCEDGPKMIRDAKRRTRGGDMCGSGGRARINDGARKIVGEKGSKLSMYMTNVKPGIMSHFHKRARYNQN